MPEALLSISEVAQAAGLKSSALRYYEKAGLIEPAARVGRRRHYDPAILQRLATIHLLQEVGFTIGEIGHLFGGGGGRESWRVVAEGKLKEIDAHLDLVNATRELLEAALQCGCSGLDTCGFVSRRRGPHRRLLEHVTLRMRPPTG